MEHDVRRIFSFLKGRGLSINERIRMRNTLTSIMREHPVRVPPAPALRPSMWEYITHSIQPASFALVFVLCLSGGVSYAAHGTLPGDSLYAVKIGFTEPIEGILAISPVAEAEWNTELVSRRLEEAAVLAAQGSLTEASRTSLESSIALRADRAIARAEELPNTDDGIVLASAIQSDLEAHLVGHERVLSAIAIEVPSEAPELAPLLSTVRQKTHEANTKRKTKENELRDGSERVRDAARAQQKTAKENVQKIRSFVISGAEHATSSEQASTSAEHIERAIAEGEEKFKSGKYRDALSTFQASVRASQALEVSISGEEKARPEITSREIESMNAMESYR
jgi:hypothetical protein